MDDRRRYTGRERRQRTMERAVLVIWAVLVAIMLGLALQPGTL